jgi:hypothetical protein
LWVLTFAKLAPEELAASYALMLSALESSDRAAAADAYVGFTQRVRLLTLEAVEVFARHRFDAAGVGGAVSLGPVSLP